MEYKPTMNLRFLGYHEAYAGGDKYQYKLQQKWIAENGDFEWRDVKTVFEYKKDG